MKAFDINFTCTVASISVYPGLHVQTCIRACSYKEHLRDICRGMFRIRQYLSKKKEKKRKELKMGFFFYSKSYMYMCVKKVEYSFAIFWFYAILRLHL